MPHIMQQGQAQLCPPHLPADAHCLALLQAAAELQRSGGELFSLEDIDFGRRLAAEKELAHSEAAPKPNVVFDDSGHFLLYPTLFGIKVVNITTNKVGGGGAGRPV